MSSKRLYEALREIAHIARVAIIHERMEEGEEPPEVLRDILRLCVTTRRAIAEEDQYAGPDSEA